MAESAFRRQFSELVAGPDEAVDLALGSLLIAAEEYPGIDIPRYLDTLERLGESASGRVEADAPPQRRVEAVNRLLFEDERFCGNLENYYDPRNSYLSDVLDRRTGIPITLSTVYMEVGRRAGLEVQGVGLPGHFIVKVSVPNGEILLDPFNAGARLSEDDCQRRVDRIFEGRVKVQPALLATCGRKEMLARTLRNLKSIYAKTDDHERCLRIVDLLLRVNPGSGEDLRDRGLLYAELDCYGLALRDLEEFLARHPGTPESAGLVEQIATLRAKAARLN